jgi:hypothetical protein
MNGAKHRRRGTKGTRWDAWERGYEFREPPCQESGTRESVGTEGSGTGGNFQSSLTTSLEFPIPHFPSPAPVGRPPFWLVGKYYECVAGGTRHLPDSGISSIPRATCAASKTQESRDVRDTSMAMSWDRRESDGEHLGTIALGLVESSFGLPWCDLSHLLCRHTLKPDTGSLTTIPVEVG